MVVGGKRMAGVRRDLRRHRRGRSEFDGGARMNEGKEIYHVDGPAIRASGRQFVWGEEGEGQTP